MAKVEFFRDAEAMVCETGDFDFLPRLGELLAIEEDGYFRHFKVVEIWHRLEANSRQYQACIRVELDD